MIASVATDTGKTTVATGVMGALRERGLRVQGFKVGPDYLDPTYHSRVTGRPSRNLDTWLMGRDGVLDSFHKASEGADVSVIEGVMGLFDGSSATGDAQSSAEVARILSAPVLLVLDAYGAGRSVALQVLGARAMGKDLNLAGVILNRVGGEGHARLCTEAVVHETGIPVLGAIPFDPEMSLPSRHLGLFSANSTLDSKLRRIVRAVRDHVELESVLELASSAPSVTQTPAIKVEHNRRSRIGVAMDECFSFYYHDNLELLRELGGELVFFSPAGDARLPEALDALVIGGGYPEINASLLEANHTMKKDILSFSESGGRLYAECGGLMYLGQTLTTSEGISHRMVGALDLSTAMGSRLTLGYTELECVRDTAFSNSGDVFRGHEYHYSQPEQVSSDCRFSFVVRRGRGIVDAREGCTVHSTVALYSHLHFSQSRRVARGIAGDAQLQKKLIRGNDIEARLASSSNNRPPLPWPPPCVREAL